MRNGHGLVGVLFLILAFGLSSVASAQEVSLDPAEQPTPAAGSTVTVAITVADIQQLSGWQVEVAFDSKVVTFDSFSEGDFLKQGGATFAVPANVRDVANDPDGLDKAVLVGVASLGDAVDGGGVLGTVTFTVVDQVATLLKVKDPVFVDPAANPIAVTTKNATLTAEGANQAPVAVAGADQQANVGEEVVFDGSASTDDVGIASYAWDFGDGSSGQGQTATHVYDAAGSYTVTLTVTDAEGLTATDTATVTVTGGAPIIREHTAGSPVLQLEAAFTGADDPEYAYIAIWQGELTIEPGQWLEYQIAMFSGNPAFQAGIDLATDDGMNLRDAVDANGDPVVDQNGLRAHPGTDLTAMARDKWYHRQIPLDALAGKTVTEIAFAVDSATHRQGLFRAFVDNVQITDKQVSVKDIYTDGDNVPLATPAPTSTTPAANGGIKAMTGAKVTAGVISVSVDPRGKLTTTWGALKQ